jgi:hypothetical protein
MDSKERVSLDDFRRVATPEAVRVLQLIHLAFLGTVSMLTFGVVLVHYMYAPEAAADAEAVGLIRMLSLGVLMMATAIYGTVMHLYPRILLRARPADAAPATPASDPATWFLVRIRTAEILRLALLEAPALFGLVVCVLAAFNGVLHAHPVYWLNALPAVVLIAYATLNFPTLDRLVDRFRIHLLED